MGRNDDGGRDGEPVGVSRISADDAFGVLQSRRRRLVVRELYGRSPPFSLWTLADRIRELEDGDDDAVRTSLHHAHLPRLDEAGAIDYDPETRTVTHCEGLEDLLETVARTVENLRSGG